jgi:hypothetical protein
VVLRRTDGSEDYIYSIFRVTKLLAAKIRLTTEGEERLLNGISIAE